MPQLSVIIPTLNRYPDLEKTLKDLEGQSFGDFEILIVDQTLARLAFQRPASLSIRYFYLPRPSASMARNVGIRESRGEILLFLDDDISIPNREFLANHIRHYSDPNVPGVSGCIMDVGGGKRSTRHRWSYKRNVGWLFFPRNYAYATKIRCGGSGNLSVRKSFAVDCGGMDENYIKGAHREESDFCMRLTEKFGDLVYDPDADLIHIGSPAGGIRNEVVNTCVKQQQHFDGAIYFTIRHVSIKDLPYHIISMLQFFFYHGCYKKKPLLLFQSFYRLVIAVRNGFRMSRAPKLFVRS